MQFGQLKRREFITLFGGGAAAWPLAARAQQAKLPMIGFLFTGSRAGAGERLRAFHQGLGEAGFVEGRNLNIEYRWGEGKIDRIPALATELVQKNVAAIFTGGPWNVRTLQALTKTIPIVFSMGEDPVKEGVVESLAHPGGNVTGHSYFGNLLFGKCLGLLREIVPNAAKIGLLVNPANPNAEPDAQQALAAAKTLGRQLVVFRAVTEGDFEPAFAAMAQSQVGGVYINVDFLFIERREQVVAAAARYSMPTMYDRRDFPAAGGLMSYGTNQAESWLQAGRYIGGILKGEKPANLPVQQATKFDLVINMKTAKALGLEFPPGVLAIADEVIE